MTGNVCRKMLENPVLTSGYKTASYREWFKKTYGYEAEHYGYDMVDKNGNTTIYAPCNLIVLESGLDSVLGNCMVLKLTGVITTDGNVAFDSLIMRINHMKQKSPHARGAYVEKGKALGMYGNTGKYSSGAHLHIEVDFDHVYPLYTPTLKANSSMFYGRDAGAHDHTMFSPGRVIPMK